MTVQALDLDDLVDEVHAAWLDHGWERSAGGRALVMELFRADQALTARVAAVLTPIGLSFARYEVLMALVFSPKREVTMSSLSAILQVHPTSMTNSINRLSFDRQVARRTNPIDARASLISITSKGRVAAKRATSRLNATVFADVGLDATGVDGLWQGLRAFRRGAGDF